MDVERIAAGLSEAGREALDWVRPFSIIAQYRAGAGEIHKLGLVRMERIGFSVTDLGLAVRQHLIEKGEG